MRDLTTGTEQVWLGPGSEVVARVVRRRAERALRRAPTAADATRSDIYSVREGGAPVVLTDQPGFKTAPIVDARGVDARPYTVAAAVAGPVAEPAAAQGRWRRQAVAAAVAARRHHLRRRLTCGQDDADGHRIGLTLRPTAARSPGSRATPTSTTLNAAPDVDAHHRRRDRAGRERIDAPALSPDGKQVAYQLMTHTDWEIYVSVDSATRTPGRIGAGASKADARHPARPAAPLPERLPRSSG